MPNGEALAIGLSFFVGIPAMFAAAVRVGRWLDNQENRELGSGRTGVDGEAAPSGGGNAESPLLQ